MKAIADKKSKTVKVTLNPADVFDQVILEFLDGKKNRAGQIKKLAYDRIFASSIIPHPSVPGLQMSVKAQGNGCIDDSKELTKKLDKLSSF